MDGYIALLDVLGFSALVNADHTGDKIRRYLECLNGATQNRSVGYVVFSDSIVLYGEGERARVVHRSCGGMLEADG